MIHARNAQDLFSEMKRKPAIERVIFSLLSLNAFRDDDFRHEQVFGQVKRYFVSPWLFIRRPQEGYSCSIFDRSLAPPS